MFPDLWWSQGAVIGFPDGTICLGYGDYKDGNIDPALPAFYSPDFFLKSSKPWRQYSQNIKLKLPPTSPEPRVDSSIPILWEDPNQSQFEDVFYALMGCIEAGILKKGVPYSFLRSNEKMSRMKLKRILQSAIDFAGRFGGMIYGFWDDKGGMIGVTPETLFKVEGNHLQTMALAGTKSREFPREALLSDPKELHEHQCVVDGIKESLLPLGSVDVGELSILELPTFYHLKTPIQVALNHIPALESLVKYLHPTPALGAIPKGPGKIWLEKMAELEPRGRYGAPFAYQEGNSVLAVVAIRNMQWGKAGIRLGAGCGVLKGSQCDREWQEIQLKCASIKTILGLR